MINNGKYAYIDGEFIIGEFTNHIDLLRNTKYIETEIYDNGNNGKGEAVIKCNYEKKAFGSIEDGVPTINKAWTNYDYNYILSVLKDKFGGYKEVENIINKI